MVEGLLPCPLSLYLIPSATHYEKEDRFKSVTRFDNLDYHGFAPSGTQRHPAV